ncbi:hypothetical protein AXF42_Ash008546 [Apostasia shenzhenica]|uniref:Uncharacterized protein n=1 Tax=Apostasia shenzhenica TaxID=1088818 RepID=A0A2I0B1P5_9ASPA|nr:hypothetical protein AXF42_Ash008546 [Apostasia shenzhenica]
MGDLSSRSSSQHQSLIPTQESCKNIAFVRGYPQITRRTSGRMQSRRLQGAQKAYGASRAPGESERLQDDEIPSQHSQESDEHSMEEHNSEGLSMSKRTAVGVPGDLSTRRSSQSQFLDPMLLHSPTVLGTAHCHRSTRPTAFLQFFRAVSGRRKSLKGTAHLFEGTLK